eukprot:15128-Heterococcus_DN1.PRE.1
MNAMSFVTEVCCGLSDNFVSCARVCSIYRRYALHRQQYNINSHVIRPTAQGLHSAAAFDCGAARTNSFRFCSWASVYAQDLLPINASFLPQPTHSTSVISSLDAALDMQAVDSAMFFDTAYIGYKQSGRGAMVTVFANIEALEDHQQAASLFVPRMVTVIQKEKVQDNGILLCKLIHKHWCLTTTPNNDQRGGELRSRRVEISELELAIAHFSLKCARPGCKGDLKVCSACNDARGRHMRDCDLHVVGECFKQSQQASLTGRSHM